MLAPRRDYIVIDIPPEETYEITIKNIKFSNIYILPKIIQTLTKLTGQLIFDVCIEFKK